MNQHNVENFLVVVFVYMKLFIYKICIAFGILFLLYILNSFELIIEIDAPKA